MTALPKSIDETLALLRQQDYVAERSLATALFLALKMERPLFLEGEAGVGKTEVAKVVARALGRDLVRLQCYEGLDIAAAVYEWNYQRQMVEIRLAEAASPIKHEEAGAPDPGPARNRDISTPMDDLARGIFSRKFLIKRPLLEALDHGSKEPPVLLIDELDRTDEPFEAYLLEVLSDWQVSIPEIGTIRAQRPPIVVITSNRTREIHDAVKRRCLYHWVNYPDAARELEIVRCKAPEAPERLSREVVAFVQKLRSMDLFKLPGVAETIDWCKALTALDAVALDPATVDDTLGVLLKYQDDIAKVRGAEAAALVSQAKAALAA
jgi:MoxR-like ATPase